MAEAKGLSKRKRLIEQSEIAPGQLLQLGSSKWLELPLRADRSVRVLSDDGKLIAYYPASIGSTEKPAPEGGFEVRGIAINPTYQYDPRYAFKGQRAKEKVKIAPGPNNPVGIVWIDLSAESYGIHGRSPTRSARLNPTDAFA